MIDYQETVKNIINENGYKTAVEVGVWKGQLSKKILECPTIKQLWLVDPYDLQLGGFPKTGNRWTQKNADHLFLYQQTRFSQEKKVLFVRKTSVEASKWIPKTEFIFIDGLHDYDNVKADIDVWFPKLKKGGTIAGHDYHEVSWPGVVNAVTDSFEEYKVEGTVWSHKPNS